jgi:hypothetical protein
MCMKVPGVRLRSPLAKLLSSRCDDTAGALTKAEIVTLQRCGEFHHRA